MPLHPLSDTVLLVTLLLLEKTKSMPSSKLFDNVLPTKELNDEYWRRGGHWFCHYNGSAATYSLVGYALAQAKDEDVPLPLTAMVHEIFKAARAAGKGSLSQPSIITLWEDTMGIRIEGE